MAEKKKKKKTGWFDEKGNFRGMSTGERVGQLTDLFRAIGGNKDAERRYRKKQRAFRATVQAKLSPKGPSMEQLTAPKKKKKGNPK